MEQSGDLKKELGKLLVSVRVSQVSAVSEGSIVLAGTGNNVTDIRLDDWDLTLHPSPKRTQLGNWIDHQPQKYRQLEAHHSPWIYRYGVPDLTLTPIRVNDDAASRLELLTEEIQSEVLPIVFDSTPRSRRRGRCLRRDRGRSRW